MITSSFWLDDYNDIYSDFDSRHYQLRRISEDFLHELRMDMRYRQQGIEELLLLVPEVKREEATEVVIINSLKKFFNTQHQLHRDKCHRKLRTSILLGITGLVIMILDATAIFLGIRSLPYHFIEHHNGTRLLVPALDFGRLPDLRLERPEERTTFLRRAC